MSKKHYIISLCSALTLIIFSIISLSKVLSSPGPPSDPEPGPPIKGGVIAGSTGSLVADHIAQIEALKIKMEKINNEGGIICANGKKRKLELIIQDYGYKAAEAVRAAQELIMKKKVDFLIGPNESGAALAVSQVAEKYKIPTGFPYSDITSTSSKMFHTYMFQMAPNAYMKGKAFALYLAKKPYKKYAVIRFAFQDLSKTPELYSWKQTMQNRVHGFKILKDAGIQISTSDFSPYISSLLAVKPDAIYCTLRGRSLIEFTKQAHSQGLLKQTILVGYFNVNFLQRINKMGIEMFPSQIGYSEAPFYAFDNPEMTEFTKLYKKRMKGEWPPEIAIMAYDTLTAFASAINRAASFSSDSIAKAFDGLEFKGLQGARYIRSEYHVTNSGVFIGPTIKDKSYPFLILEPLIYFPGDDLWRQGDRVTH